MTAKSYSSPHSSRPMAMSAGVSSGRFSMSSHTSLATGRRIAAAIRHSIHFSVIHASRPISHDQLLSFVQYTCISNRPIAEVLLCGSHYICLICDTCQYPTAFTLSGYGGQLGAIRVACPGGPDGDRRPGLRLVLSCAFHEFKQIVQVSQPYMHLNPRGLYCLVRSAVQVYSANPG